MRRVTAAFLLVVLSVIGVSNSALAHPGRGIVATVDGTIYFADAGRSVVWKCKPDGTMTAAAPGVHSHWLALDPSGTMVYADHQPYDTETKRFSQGMVRITATGSTDEVTDVIKPESKPLGLSSGSFVIESKDQIVRVSGTDSAKLVRGPFASPDEKNDSVIGVLDGASHVGGIAATINGKYIMTVKDEVRSMDSKGAVMVVASAESIARAASQNPAVHESMYEDRLWGLCVLKDGASLVCDPSNRRVLRVGADGVVSVWYTSSAPWSPVGITTRGEDVVILDAGFEHPSRNLGPRVVLRKSDGSIQTLFEVDEKEPSRPYREFVEVSPE